MGAISELHSFNTLTLRPSDQDALCTLSPFNSLRAPLRAPLGLTVISLTVGKWACAFGRDFSVSPTRECTLKLFIENVFLIKTVRLKFHFL